MLWIIVEVRVFIVAEVGVIIEKVIVKVVELDEHLHRTDSLIKRLIMIVIKAMIIREVVAMVLLLSFRLNR